MTTTRRLSYALSLAMIGGASLLAWLLRAHFELPNIIMVYLAAVVVVAYYAGRGPSILAAFLAVMSFSFFDVPPVFGLSTSEGQYVLTLVIMLAVGLLISSLSASLRTQAAQALGRERQTALLYALTREFSARRGREELVTVLMEQLNSAFGPGATVFLADRQRRLVFALGAEADAEAQAARAWQGERVSGIETMDITGVTGRLGMLLAPTAWFGALDDEGRRRLLPAMLYAGALALERELSSEEVQVERMKVESERLRNSLLSTVSHDLRTPLSTILGASSSLVADEMALADADRRALTRLVYDEAQRMRKMIDNILDMARLEAGPVGIRTEWQPLEEVLGEAVRDVTPRLGARELVLALPDELPWVNIDPVLMERVLVNLLDNAIKHASGARTLRITVEVQEDRLWVHVDDDGCGLPQADTERVFEKFYRAGAADAGLGVGLGLAICRSIVRAHQGDIRAERRAAGGGRFRFWLAVVGAPESGLVGGDKA
ncbi:MAG: ATP-binding protein [Moraxellaceae bacterium]